MVQKFSPGGLRFGLTSFVAVKLLKSFFSGITEQRESREVGVLDFLINSCNVDDMVSGFFPINIQTLLRLLKVNHFFPSHDSCIHMDSKIGHAK